MLSRQRTILRMLAVGGGKLNKLDLHKLLFLLSEEYPSLPRTARHEFVPYHRGPFSFTVAHDLAKLEHAGMLVEDGYGVLLTSLGGSEGRAVIADADAAVRDVYAHYGQMSTDELIDHVYRNYQWYTMNSKWPERRLARRPNADIQIYTTGYEDVTLDGLLNRLLCSGIERLIDVRANPVARRYGFHRSTLSRNCPAVGIEYVHFPELGVPSEWRSALVEKASHQNLFARYARELLPHQEEALARLGGLIRERPSALMCKETDPRCCHRSTLAREMASRIELPIYDLGTEESGAPH